MSLGNCKLKQWDPTTHRLEWPKARTLATPKGKDVEQQELSLIADGKADGPATLEDSLTVS